MFWKQEPVCHGSNKPCGGDIVPAGTTRQRERLPATCDFTLLPIAAERFAHDCAGGKAAVCSEKCQVRGVAAAAARAGLA